MNERDRIEFIMKCYDLSPSQLADKTGIQRASVSHILSGRNKASLDVMLKVHGAFPDVDLEWLMTGSGIAPSVAIQKEEKMPHVENELFSMYDDKAVPEKNISEELPLRQMRQAQPKVQQERPVRKQNAMRQQHPVTNRQIKEVRIFYSDGTYETLFPEK